MKKTFQSTQTTFQTLPDWQKLISSPIETEVLLKYIKQKDFFTIDDDHESTIRQHSSLIDKILGFDIRSVEEKLIKNAQKKLPDGSYEYWGPALHEGNQTWVGLDVQTLNSPYKVLHEICEMLNLKHGMSVVDLGSAHGRLGIVMNQVCPNAYFKGLEFVPERVEEANRIYKKLGLTNAQCEVCDLFDSSFVMPEVDVYFIYDYGKHEHISATLGQISEEATKRKIKVVVRGKVTNTIIADHHPWLNLVSEHTNFLKMYEV
ncbi:MAG: class I SAM-dependent methyltransferase [Bacteriovoracaceae bacterium]|nr:class I SAM-dependent methyltransferase [Bacteriovoracaceae bacterium]